MYGVLQPPPGTVGDTRTIPFPYNVSFRQENYVLESDELLEGVRPEFDLILCLSITKWIHLNSGDDGLKRFFRRAFLHLRPGGKLILEPQPWSSYKRKKKLTEKIFETFKAIRFYPDKFQDYLLKEVGFSTMEKLTTPTHSSKGFQRPLMVFTKAEATPRRSPNSPNHPQFGLVEMITTSVPASLSASPATAPEQPSSPKPDSVPEKNL
jgi:7SK snRNA methylphosphate capping enzyme